MVRLAVARQDRLDGEAVELRASSFFPVTVRICAAGTDWLASFSVVTGAPTTRAPVRSAIEAASAMWSKWPWPMTITSARFTSAAAKPSVG
jgi:hypothetical protein